eukprot:3258475-Prymnesium_polylepis.1
MAGGTADSTATLDAAATAASTPAHTAAAAPAAVAAPAAAVQAPSVEFHRLAASGQQRQQTGLGRGLRAAYHRVRILARKGVRQ